MNDCCKASIYELINRFDIPSNLLNYLRETEIIGVDEVVPVIDCRHCGGNLLEAAATSVDSPESPPPSPMSPPEASTTMALFGGCEPVNSIEHCDNVACVPCFNKTWGMNVMNMWSDGLETEPLDFTMDNLTYDLVEPIRLDSPSPPPTLLKESSPPPPELYPLSIVPRSGASPMPNIIVKAHYDGNRFLTRDVKCLCLI